MGKVEILTQFEQIKAMADPRRLEILRLVMAEPASLTQLGVRLGQHPARVRHHMQKLESAGLVEINEITVTSGVTEKFYRACAGAYLMQQMVLPKDNHRKTIIFSGSHDLAIEQLTQALGVHVNLLSLAVGSLDGLVALRQGFCHIAGSHLLDTNGEYNTPYVQRLLPDRRTTMITLAYREQGLILAPGNPKGIHDLADLTRPDVTFINRQPGSGTRLWLEAMLKTLGIPSSKIRGFENAVQTHTETAQAIQSGRVDTGIGLQAAAGKLNLDFIPLFNERYDLTMMSETCGFLAPLLNHLQTRVCRNEMGRLSGYNTTHTGEQIIL
jgi:putative molybdopterin biosynthesis protein